MTEKISENGITYFEYPVGDELRKMFVSSDPSRLEEETQEEYKARRKLNSGSLKRFKKGRAIWNPYIMGNTKGLEYNERNVATITAWFEQLKKREEENEQDIAE